MLISLSLGVMIILTVFSIIAGAEWLTIGIQGSLAGPESMGGAGAFSIDPLAGAIGIIVIVVMLAVIFGLRFFSSGLSESSIKTIIVGLSYGSLWVLFSVFAQPLLVQIKMFGSLFYVVLTIVFVIGVIQKITRGL